jgi:hypothetical protein
MSARDELAAFALDVEHLERLIDGFEPADGTPLEDPEAFAALVRALRAARAGGTRAALAYVAELAAPPKKPATLETRRARVVSVYVDGFKSGLAGEVITDAQLAERAHAYAAGKVPK